MSQTPSSQNQPQNPDSSQQYYQQGYGYQEANAYPAEQSQSGAAQTGGYDASGYGANAQAAGAYGSVPYAGAAQPTAASYAENEEKVGFFKALFDLKFEHFITIKFAAVIYVIAIVVSILTWIGNTIALFIIGAAASNPYYGTGPSGEGMVLGLLSLFLGWIPAVIQILVTRIVLEFVVSSIRTAQNTTALVHKN